MNELPDRVLDHLREVADWPDLSATKYEPIEKIGQGGMASVYRAHDRDLDRPVAIKILSDLGADGSARARMLEEARIISRLEHPGIVPIHDSGVLPDGRIYFAMKLVRGKRLDEHVHNEMNLNDRLAIYEKICQTVAFAHAYGVIHRDLKPQNVMVGPFGEVLVMDWGVAKKMGTSSLPQENPSSLAANAAASGQSKTVPGTVLGTPGYMAPEQVSGDVSRIDHRTDIFGLGGVLYFLLTRRPPLELQHGGQSVPVLPRQRNRAIPRPLEAICLKALAPDPTNRYATVQELIDDIDSFRSHKKVQAYPEGLLSPITRFVSKYRAAIFLILAYLLMRLVLILIDSLKRS
jgi:eukaryotic-like serine/threonine-protein kinase